MPMWQGGELQLYLYQGIMGFDCCDCNPLVISIIASMIDLGVYFVALEYRDCQ